MKPTSIRHLLCLLGLCLLSGAAAAQDLLEPIGFCVVNGSTTRDAIVPDQTCTAANRQWHQIYARFNKPFHPVSTKYPSVTRGIIFVHGSGSKPSPGYLGITDRFAPPVAGGYIGDDATTWVIAPQLLELTHEGNPLPDTGSRLHWSRADNTGYNVGDPSLYPEGVNVSSFDLLDFLIERMVIRAKNLTEIIVIGHSAGGRTVNRYSMVTRIDQAPIDGRTIKFRYIVASPSAFMYLSDKRYKTNNATPPAYTEVDPDSSACSTTYDDYPYGMLDMFPAPHYVNGLTRTTLVERIKKKNVLYLVGSEDNFENGPEQTCEAKLQGKQRVDRALVYWEHLRVEQARTNALICVVPDKDHSPRPMIASAAAGQYWHNGTVNPADCVPPSQWTGVSEPERR